MISTRLYKSAIFSCIAALSYSLGVGLFFAMKNYPASILCFTSAFSNVVNCFAAYDFIKEQRSRNNEST
jgi:hypothetical protein